MAQAKKGDSVGVQYVGRLDDGTVFSKSNGDSLQFTIGKGQTILGLEQAVIGMEPGESKTVEIPPEKAYGPHSKEKVASIDRSRVPPNLSLEIGQRLQVAQEAGDPIPVTVTEISESKVTLDANHPLAGKNLTFHIQLVGIG